MYEKSCNFCTAPTVSDKAAQAPNKGHGLSVTI